jgi:hypothetical protein
MNTPTNEEIKTLLLPLLAEACKRNPDTHQVSILLSPSDAAPYITFWPNDGNSGAYGVEAALANVKDGATLANERMQKARDELAAAEAEMKRINGSGDAN